MVKDSRVGRKQNAVSTRPEELGRVVSGAKRPLILIYGSPDPDSLASAWALRELMRRHSKTPRIRYTGEVGRLENQTMIESLGIPVKPMVQRDLATTDLIALTDCQPEFFAPLDLPRCDVVIDHHPRKSRRQYAFSDIRPKCLATSYILIEYLQQAAIELSPRMATALYYGIQTDSRHILRSPAEVDAEVMDYLERKVRMDLLRRIEYSSYSLERLDYFSIALIKLRHANGVLYSHLGPVSYSDICVQVADFLSRVKEARWALVSGIVAGKLIVVFRCDANRRHAGKTAEAAFGPFGSAGGHRTSARAEVAGSALPQELTLMQNETMEWFVIDTLSQVDREFKALRELLVDSKSSL